MNPSTLTRMKILVERAVRPVRAGAARKATVREELLAHLTAVFEEELGRLGDEQAALARTGERFGDPVELTGQLQASVPALDSIDYLIDRLADWAAFQPGESTLRRAVRYALLSAAATLLLLLFMLLGLRGALGEWPPHAIRLTAPVLLIGGYLGVTLCLCEASLRRLLGERTGRSWLQLALIIVGSTVVSLALGLGTFGVSLDRALWLFFFTVGFPLGLAGALARGFAARDRYHEEWGSLLID